MSQRILLHVSVFVAALIPLACSHATGTHPKDMGATAHDEAAATVDAQADQHDAKYDPEGARLDTGCIDYCFWTNPTSEHKTKAKRMRRVAAKHRKASEELRLIEAEACGEVPEENRDLSPFFFRERVREVQTPDSGAIRVRFEPVPGVSLAQFETLVQCHLARNATMGFPIEGMDYCPLALPGVQANLSVVEGGVEVAMTVKEPEVRLELVERAKQLSQPTSED